MLDDVIVFACNPTASYKKSVFQVLPLSITENPPLLNLNVVQNDPCTKPSIFVSNG